MTIRVDLVNAKASSRPTNLLTDLQSRQADYLLVGDEASGPGLCDAVARFIDGRAAEDLIAVCDLQSRHVWQQLHDVLPPLLSLLASPPDDQSVVAFHVKSLDSNHEIVQTSESIGELVVHLAEQGTVAFVSLEQVRSPANIPAPPLTTNNARPGPAWLRRAIQQLQVPGRKGSSTEQTALKAGLFLLNDFCEESHACSQSIEGMGTHHHGDYWHAILHRREPDYGNSKYWFRHVGRHPIFAELAQTAESHLEAATGSLAAKLEKWKPRLAGDRWDPFPFVDLCAAAENDAELRGWCEQLQLAEMLLLLKSNYRDLVGQ